MKQALAISCVDPIIAVDASKLNARSQDPNYSCCLQSRQQNSPCFFWKKTAPKNPSHCSMAPTTSPFIQQVLKQTPLKKRRVAKRQGTDYHQLQKRNFKTHTGLKYSTHLKPLGYHTCTLEHLVRFSMCLGCTRVLKYQNRVTLFSNSFLIISLVFLKLWQIFL